MVLSHSQGRKPKKKILSDWDVATYTSVYTPSDRRPSVNRTKTTDFSFARPVNHFYKKTGYFPAVLCPLRTLVRIIHFYRVLSTSPLHPFIRLFAIWQVPTRDKCFRRLAVRTSTPFFVHNPPFSCDFLTKSLYGCLVRIPPPFA